MPQDLANRTIRVLMLPDFRHHNPYQELLAQSLREQAVEVVFYAHYRRVFPLYRITREVGGIEVLHLHWLSSYWRGESWLARLVYGLKLLADILLVKSSGTRLVWTLHNLIAHDCLHPRMEARIRRAIYGLADEVIVHSASARDRVSTEFRVRQAERSRVVAHGHYRSLYRDLPSASLARERLGISRDEVVILFFGMLKPYKGLEELIAAWGSAGEASRPARLVIAGMAWDDAYGRRLDDLVRDRDDIRLDQGFVPEDQVSDYFVAARVVVFPFRSILTSGSVLLAMSFGRAVMAPRFNEMAELLSGADDLLYDPDDPHGLREALLKADRIDLADLEARTTRICDGFDWSPIGRLTARVYREALGKSS